MTPRQPTLDTVPTPGSMEGRTNDEQPIWHAGLSRDRRRWAPDVDRLAPRALLGWADAGVPARAGPRGVTIADLTVVGDDERSRELIVGVVADGADRRGAEELIVRWAAPSGSGACGSRTPSSRSATTLHPGDGDRRLPDVSSRVGRRPAGLLAAGARAGVFPASCPICNGLMPQWSVLEGEVETTVPTERPIPTLSPERSSHDGR